MSETKPTMDTASEQPADRKGACPAFVQMEAGEKFLAEPTAWLTWIKGRAAVFVEPDTDTPDLMHLRVDVEPYDAPAGCLVAVRVILPAGKAARKLRRLATFARDQKRFPQEMDVQDELRAMEVLAKTLDSVGEDTASRVLAWLNARAQAADLKRLGRGARTGSPLSNTFADAASLSVRIAKKHVLGGEDHYPDNPVGSHAGDPRT